MHCFSFGFKGSQCQAELIRLQVFVGNAQTTINTVHSIKALDHKPSEKKKWLMLLETNGPLSQSEATREGMKQLSAKVV